MDNYLLLKDDSVESRYLIAINSNYSLTKPVQSLILSKRYVITWVFYMTFSRYLIGAGSAVIASIICCGYSNAQQSEELSKQEFEKPDVQELQQQIDDLKSQVDELSDIAENNEPEVLNSQNDFELTWEPGPVFTSKDGKFSFEINGRVSYDYANITYKDGNGNVRPDDKVNGTDLRHLEFGFQGSMFEDFSYRVVTKFTDNQAQLKMAYLDYETGNTKFTFGQTRTFTTLDKMTPPTMMAFTERFAFINAVGVYRRIGIAAAQHGEDWSVSGGYFFENASDADPDDNNMISGRANYSPRLENGVGLHFGASAFYRNRNSNPYDLEYSTRPLSKQGDIKPLFSGDFNVDNEQFVAGEFVATYKSFGLQAEYATIKTPLSDMELQTMTTPSYSGGYVEVGFFPTGGEQMIDGQDGRLDSVEVRSPLGQGGIGEIRLAGRYDVADFTHEIFGRKQTSYILAADWYLNSAIKITANYAHSIIKDAMNVRTDVVDTINTRFLFNF